MIRRPKALIIGQAPQRSAGPDTRPWDSHSGRRLAKFMGCTHEEMMAAFETDNLNVKLAGTKGKYDLFDMEEARQRAAMFKERIDAGEWHYVLCCGQKVCQLMGVHMYKWYVFGKNTFVLGLPHPGGTNMHLNDPENRKKFEKEARLLWDMLSGGVVEVG